MRRIAIVGSSAAGKSTLARALAKRLDLPHLELDSVYHQAGWTTLPTPEFRARVGEFVSGDRCSACHAGWSYVCSCSGSVGSNCVPAATFADFSPRAGLRRTPAGGRCPTPRAGRC